MSLARGNEKTGVLPCELEIFRIHERNLVVDSMDPRPLDLEATLDHHMKFMQIGFVRPA